MKFSSKWVTAWISLLFASSALSVASAVNYSDAFFHYTIDFPTGWENLNQKPPSIAFGGRMEKDFRTNINIISEPSKEVSLSRYIQSVKVTLGKLKAIKILSEKKCTLGGESAVQLRMHLSLPGKPPIDDRQIICLRNKRAFLITCTALTETYKKSDPLFDKTLNTFKWGK